MRRRSIWPSERSFSRMERSNLKTVSPGVPPGPRLPVASLRSPGMRQPLPRSYPPYLSPPRQPLNTKPVSVTIQSGRYTSLGETNASNASIQRRGGVTCTWLCDAARNVDTVFCGRYAEGSFWKTVNPDEHQEAEESGATRTQTSCSQGRYPRSAREDLAPGRRLARPLRARTTPAPR
jgi:hypothetical protein